MAINNINSIILFKENFYTFTSINPFTDLKVKKNYYFLCHTTIFTESR
jgi:hypothetical protein